jgi:hypothetical protein
MWAVLGAYGEVEREVESSTWPRRAFACARLAPPGPRRRAVLTAAESSRRETLDQVCVSQLRRRTAGAKVTDVAANALAAIQ